MNDMNDMNDINALEIDNLLTAFNKFDPKGGEIRLIEKENKDKIKLLPSEHNKFRDSLDRLEIEFHDNLNNLKWYYIAHLKYPNYQEYSNNYYKIKNRLDSILNEMTIIGIDIQKNIDYLNIISIKINRDLDRYRKENDRLKNKVKNVESVDSTSKGIVDDYTELYKNQRSYNIGMVITFIMAFFIMRRIFSPMAVTSKEGNILQYKNTDTNTNTNTNKR